MMRVLALGMSLLLVAACSSESSDSLPTSTEVSQTELSTTSTRSSLPATASSPSSTASPTASCAAETILPVVRAALDGSNGVASVTVADCRNGYARVWATPVEPNQQNEQVFLQDVDGEWTVVDIGTGIECTDAANLNEADQAACNALGLSP